MKANFATILYMCLKRNFTHMSENELEELLIREGWPINGKQLSDFLGGPISRIQDVNQLKRQLLDADMHEYALPLLSERINRQLGEFKGPLVVQVVKPRNVSYPKYSETTHTDGLVKIQISDGFSSIQALLFEPIPKLNAETPPGTKLCLVGKIPIENGMLLINGINCQVLGGNVEKMIEKWNMKKNWLQKPMRTTEGSAPKWIQFSKQRQPQSSLPINATDRMFRASDVINGLSKIDERDDDFSAARKAQIEQVVENNAIKTFARSQLKPKLLGNAASTSCNSSCKKDPTIKAKPDVENTNRLQRPSNPPTLFDFMQSKVPISDKSFWQQNHGNQELEKTEANAEIQEMDRSRRNKYNEKGFRNRQTVDNGTGSRVIEISNSNRYRKQPYRRLERERNSATNVAADKFRSNCADDQSKVEINMFNFAELSALNISPVDNGQVNVSKDRNTPQKTIYFENKSHDYQHNAVYRQMYEKQQSQHRHQQTFDNMVLNGGTPPVWKIGDKCLAPWSDGQFYPSTLVSMGPADMCTVEYDEYGNRSSVPVGLLKHMIPRYASTAARVIKGTIRHGVSSKVALWLTPEAVKRVKYLLSKQPETTALKISVRQRGCNGLTYTLDYAEQRAKFDEEVVQDGVRLWIDPKAQLTLLGSEMDYVEDRLSSEFVFRNPNIKSTCGCGESFSI
uniref:Iron-sulfur cluster assembly 1 homolog, mitochondrial n=1 Tax=Elaeophora elaphi TaxID=1147741 RepID=A0A0R3RVW2_9BILA